MRKTILLLLSFISLVFNLYANQGFINNPLKDNKVSFENQYKEWKSKFNFESLTNPLDISGRVDPYANIQIVIIESTEENNFQGIPFDIMGDDVTNSAKAGRRIGDFTIFSNFIIPVCSLVIKENSVSSSIIIGRAIFAFK